MCVVTGECVISKCGECVGGMCVERGNKGRGWRGRSGIKRYDTRKKVHNLNKSYETRIKGTKLD